MPLGLPFLGRIRIVDDRYKSVPVMPKVEDHVALYRIGIVEGSAHFVKIVPANRLYNHGPSFNFVRCIRVGFYRLPEVLTRNDMHLMRILHNL